MAKEPKLVICKNCNTPIPKDAKVCPACGTKNAKPFYKKGWFIILIIVVVAAVIIAAGSGGSSGSGDTHKVGEVDTPASTPAGGAGGAVSAPGGSGGEPTPTPAPVQTVFKVGDILRDGDLEIVYMSSGEYVSDNQFMQPAEGNKYIFIQLAFENVSDSHDESVSMYSFECYADGYSADMYFGGEDNLSATLSPGRSTSGYMYFEVPQDASEIEIEYETNVFTEKKITFTYEGEQDSGYVLEGNSTPTPGALSIGETAESKSLNITYLNCFRDESDNMFIKPKDGYHYVTCEFELENTSSSDQTVTFYSFDCYADGINCDMAYFRDDALSASMSPGRKAKGTVTFEVPDGAAVVEVEYLSNIWTSNRVVFTAAEQG